VKTVILAMLAMITFSAQAIEVPAKVKALHDAMDAAALNCDKDLEAQPVAYDLGNNNVLTLVPCYMGAYQGSGYGYLSNEKYESVTQVVVLAYDDTSTSVEGTTNLMEASFDPQTNVLSTFAKGRGLADCGQSSQSKISVDEYGTVHIKTFEIRSKFDCDEKYDEWPIVFEQTKGA
jgi:hypothetical protein